MRSLPLNTLIYFSTVCYFCAPRRTIILKIIVWLENPITRLSYTEFSIECEECKTAAAEVKCTTCKNYLCDKCFEMVSM